MEKKIGEIAENFEQGFQPLPIVPGQVGDHNPNLAQPSVLFKAGKQVYSDPGSEQLDEPVLHH